LEEKKDRLLPVLRHAGKDPKETMIGDYVEMKGYSQLGSYIHGQTESSPETIPAEGSFGTRMGPREREKTFFAFEKSPVKSYMPVPDTTASRFLKTSGKRGMKVRDPSSLLEARKNLKGVTGVGRVNGRLRTGGKIGPSDLL